MSNEPKRRRTPGMSQARRRTKINLNHRFQEGTTMMTITEAPEREELIARIRREIALGTYDTPEKFEAALGLMVDTID